MGTGVIEDPNADIGENERGEQKVNQYILKDIIGKGAYGIVSKAINKNTGVEYAIKEFSKSRLRKKNRSNMMRPAGMGGIRGRKTSFAIRATGLETGESDDPMNLIKGELAILKKLNHKNTVNLFEVLMNKDEDSLFMVFEMCERGPILNVSSSKNFDHYSPEESRLYFKSIVLGVEYLHENGIAHRDLKPDNILLNKDGVLKIVDFGVSEIFEDGNDKLKGPTGSPAFMAPELHLAKPGTYGELSAKAIDIWAMGVILYCLVFGRIPFQGSNVLEIRESIHSQELQIPDGTDPSLKDVLVKLLAKDPSQRITMNSLRGHPWLTKNGEDPLISLEENIKNVVTELTDADVRDAIKSIGSIFRVIQAVNRFKNPRNRSKSEISE